MGVVFGINEWGLTVTLAVLLSTHPTPRGRTMSELQKPLAEEPFAHDARPS